jgi:uncharacterized protein (DUF488 family)
MTHDAPESCRILTIGHSTRPIEEFIALLESHSVTHVIDVRTIPRSRRHPHFSSDALAASLGAAGIAYTHLPDLGGLRRPRPDSPNTGWRNESFRGYADHMQSAAFAAAIDALIALSRDSRCAIMCAEAVPWRCHRSLIADALAARGCAVEHIMSRTKREAHAITAWAQVDGDRVTYAAPLDTIEP